MRDTLHLEVTVIGNQERFAWRNARKLEDKELRDLVGKGTIGTGTFALYTKHVFEPGHAEFKAQGEVSYQGRRALRYTYEVPWDNSGYRIRVAPYEEVVAFRGSFLIDADTLDLLRLEVFSDEIPPELGLDRVLTTLEYSTVTIGAWAGLFPTSSELTMTGLDGTESRNRTKLAECRQYGAESKLSFDEPAPAPAEAPVSAAAPELVSRLTMELALEGDIALATAAIGDPVRAALTRPLMNGDRLLAPEGAVVLGNIVRLDKQKQPFDRYEVALEFHTLESSPIRYELSATMVEAGPASGLIKQAKRLNPTFTRERKARMDILVREIPRGQGVLQWDAKQGRIRKGLRMRWLVDSVTPTK